MCAICIQIISGVEMNNKYQIDIDIDDKVVIKNTNNNT